MHEQFKIKPCPFCSYTELMIEIEDNKVFVKCGLCESRGPEFEHQNIFSDNFSHEEAQDLAFERWNYRPIPEEEYDEEKDMFYDGNIGKDINQAIEVYMKNKLMVEEPVNIKKLLVACDLLSFLKKPPGEE